MVENGALSIKPLFNKQGKPASLRIPDKFFYNQHFFLRKPTQQMEELGWGNQGNKYTMRWFDKNRFIGVIGRVAFHVFDLEAIDFITADEKYGFERYSISDIYTVF